jgi:uncharacterized protein YjbI with pentapeptide repeats
VTVLSGTREGGRVVRALPANEAASAVVRAWAESSDDILLDAAGLDLSGADLSGADLAEALLTEAVLREVRLRGADLYRAHLEGADLSHVDLSHASLVKATFDESVLTSASLEGANLGRASLWGVDASAARFRGATLDGASLIRMRLAGADFSDVSVRETSFKVLLDENTVVTGMSGTVFGPAELVERDSVRQLAGEELERWLHAHGAEVRVLTSGKLS